MRDTARYGGWIQEEVSRPTLRSEGVWPNQELGIGDSGGRAFVVLEDARAPMALFRTVRGWGLRGRLLGGLVWIGR